MMDITVHILSKEQILENLALYQSQIDEKLVDEPTQIIEQLTVAESIMVNSGKMLADAKYWLNEAMHSETIKTLKELASQNKLITSTAVNQIIKSLCKDQQYLVDWCERLNRSSTHRADLARSIISKQKAEMQNRI
jgi:hypothetical protein